ncbi:MAG TPA: hypothetical protein VHT73_12770 [Thermodesulfobacteriota bacterium]|nr:hypothetical protein [Thermodesulfobacteriota bacterium]
MENEKTGNITLREQIHRFLISSGFELALRLTLLEILLRPIGNWMLRPFILGLAAVGLVFPGLLLKSGFWMSLTFFTGLRVVLDWPLADNHAYLLCYWCLAVSIALLAKDTGNCLALNGRLLIGLAFAFAVLWKLALSPDYIDGRFFRYIMLTDDRFEALVRLVGGFSFDALEELRAFVRQHIDGQFFEMTGIPGQPERFLSVAKFATLWTVAIEALVAIAFLSPVGKGLSKLRDVLLIIFCIATYAIAPVEGFGWLLIAMGIAQCEPERRIIRLLYLIVFFIILFYREVPWVDMLLDHIQTE